MEQTIMEQTILERVDVGNRTMVDMSVLRQSLNVEQYMDDQLRAMVISIRGYVLAEEVDNRTTTVKFQLDIPANWWEHFKRDVLQRLFKGKLKLRFQRIVRVKSVTFRKLATYPKANIAIPELGTTIVYRTQIYEDNP